MNGNNKKIERRSVKSGARSVEWVAIDQVRVNPRNARTHSKKQVHQIAVSIKLTRLHAPE